MDTWGFWTLVFLFAYVAFSLWFILVSPERKYLRDILTRADQALVDFLWEYARRATALLSLLELMSDAPEVTDFEERLLGLLEDYVQAASLVDRDRIVTNVMAIEILFSEFRQTTAEHPEFKKSGFDELLDYLDENNGEILKRAASYNLKVWFYDRDLLCLVGWLAGLIDQRRSFRLFSKDFLGLGELTLFVVAPKNCLDFPKWS